MSTYVLIIATSLGILMFLPLILLLIGKSTHATILAFSWERSIVIEQEVWMRETSSRGFPQGYRNGSMRQELRYYNPMAAQDLYDTWYTYEVLRWYPYRTVSSVGESQVHVHWPDYNLASNERCGKKIERYAVYFTAVDGKRYDIQLEESIWATLDSTARYLLKTTLFGQVVKIQPVQENGPLSTQEASENKLTG